MTAAALPRLAGSSRAVFGEMAITLLEGILEGRTIAARYDRLSRLSNSELARLGLTRADISRVAVSGTAGV